MFSINVFLNIITVNMISELIEVREERRNCQKYFTKFTKNYVFIEITYVLLDYMYVPYFNVQIQKIIIKIIRDLSRT